MADRWHVALSKLHCPSWRTCSAPAVQDLRKRLSIFTEIAFIECSPGWKPIDEDGAVET
jgi:hypothetical protein